MINNYILAKINPLIIRIGYHHNLFQDIHPQHSICYAIIKRYPYILFTHIYIANCELPQMNPVKSHYRSFYKSAYKLLLMIQKLFFSQGYINCSIMTTSIFCTCINQKSIRFYISCN